LQDFRILSRAATSTLMVEEFDAIDIFKKAVMGAALWVLS